ncbi:hypothetical protein CBR_g48688 [Chara braunii]|uniref:Uncharacterized protein n=1 Tax=Chara braunii TaxID=69332 RepID=A0A388K4F7_CHABU|nr:hypothetical protein CBR_g48688 [Chara braunii]|eukprot:GBG64940.1 hypothetical protein CBR_g48688 [Chara braunii]
MKSDIAALRRGNEENRVKGEEKGGRQWKDNGLNPCLRSCNGRGAGRRDEREGRTALQGRKGRREEEIPRRKEGEEGVQRGERKQEK